MLPSHFRMPALSLSFGLVLGGSVPAFAQNSAASGSDYALSPDGGAVVRITPSQSISSANLNTSLISGQFAGWTVEKGGIGGTVSTSAFEAGWKGDAGGARLLATFANGQAIPAGSSLNWIQVIDTTKPLGGSSNHYLDPRPNDDSLPFYWTSGEAAAFGGISSVRFSDYSTRLASQLSGSGSIKWSAALFPALYDGSKGIKIGNGISWGWEMKKAMVGSTSATFTAPSPGSAVTSGVGTATFFWGTGSPSSLSFAPTSFDASPNQKFKLGTLTFHNGVIASDSGADRVSFNLSFKFDNVPEKNFTSTTPFSLTNTPNTNNSPQASADFVSVGQYNFTFNVLEEATSRVDLFGILSTGLALSSTFAAQDKAFDGPFDASPDFFFTFAGFGTPTGGGFIGGLTIAKLVWDGGELASRGNGLVDGGSGTWNATAPNWTDPVAIANGAYTGGAGAALFQGAAGTVTVDDADGPITIEGLTFLTDGYRIAGDSLDLASTGAIVEVDNASAASAATATVDSKLTGAGGLVKTGPGTLVLGSSNSYRGTTTIAEGTVIGLASSFGSGAIVNNAVLRIDAPTAAEFANDLGGTGRLIKAGPGTLAMTGDNLFSGSTTAQAGLLRVDGYLGNSEVIVNDGATLGGAGFVGATQALTGARVAPGGSIGTLHVAGDYRQAANSTYAVELNSSGASDQLSILGAATLAPGAKLEVTKVDPAPYVLGQRYVVLGAAGGLTGTYLLSGDTRVSLFYGLAANYDSNFVYLDVAQTRSFASVGATPNQRASAAAADALPGGPLFGAIANLQTEADAQAAFDAISGEVHGAIRNAAFEDSRFVREAMSQPSGSTGRAFWGYAYGTWAHQRSDGNAGRLSRDAAGMLIGADLVRTGDLKAGILGGYGEGKLRLRSRGSTATSRDYHLGVYGRISTGPVAARAGGAYMMRKVGTYRSAVAANFADALSSDYDVNVAQIFGEIAIPVGVGPVTIEPVASAAWVRSDTDDAAETGGAARLFVRADDAEVHFTTLGMRMTADLAPNASGTSVRLRAAAGWRHAGGDLSTAATMNFADGAAFETHSLPIAQDVLQGEIALEATLGSKIMLSLVYGAQTGDRLLDQGIKGVLRIGF